MINTNVAISAYQRAMKEYAAANTKHAEAINSIKSINNVSDNIDVVETKSFASVLAETIEPEIRKIKRVETQTKQVFTPEANDVVNAPDLVELTSTVNEAMLHLEAAIAARDKFVIAFNKIYDMAI